MNGRRPDAASEQRLEALRREAEATGQVAGAGVRPVASPMPEPAGPASYHGLPILKAPVWTWEVPAYFFVGGAAGAAACIAFAARVSGGDAQLVRNAQWLALGGAVLSTPLLIADLGRPERFLNMLRVFKPQSPMSVGAWLLAAFGTAAGAAVVVRGLPGDVFTAVAAVSGLGMATYTGVLLGVTAIPVWADHAQLLPVHFGASALGAAASALELTGRRDRALRTINLFAAAAETVLDRKLGQRRETSGLTMGVAGALSGPIPLLIRLLYGRSRRARQAAAVSSLIGSLMTRIAWVEAGQASAAAPVKARPPRARREPVSA